MMRFIPTRVHGVLDYVMGAVLIALPFILGIGLDGGAASWVPILVGAFTIVQSLFTDYELGLVRRIPMSAHLAMDIVGGAFLAASPWLFGFADEINPWPYLVLGLAEVAAGLTTRKTPDYARHGLHDAEREHLDVTREANQPLGYADRYREQERQRKVG